MIIETVGVGQDEVDVARVADVTVVVLVPGMGDDVQTIKAGIMEIADVFVINKADHAGVAQTEQEIRQMQSLSHRADGWVPPVVRTIAIDGTGVDELLAAIGKARAANAARGPVALPPSAIHIDHLGIAVKSIEAALGFYAGQLGMNVSLRETVAQEKVHVAMLPVGGPRIELLEPSDPDSVIAKFIAKRGEGLHHVALRVPDLDAAVERLRAAGARLLNEPRAGAGGHSVRFRAPRFDRGRVIGIDSGIARRQYLQAQIGIIGGSGLYSMPGFEAQKEIAIETPWGAPSDKFALGTLAGKPVAFLARHGRGHRISPSELNFRANIYGMKSLGVERIISLSAVGLAQGGTPAARFRHSRSVLRPHARPRLHIFRRRIGRARQLCRSRLPATGRCGRTVLPSPPA